MIDNVIRYNITIKCGADYDLNFSFEADDDSEIENYGALVYSETLYETGDSSVTDEVWETSDDWSVEDETLIGTGIYEVEGQLREFQEASDSFDFGFVVDNEGFHMLMPRSVTEKIPYTKGYYDVFITERLSGLRSKLMEGVATIIPAVTR